MELLLHCPLFQIVGELCWGHSTKKRVNKMYIKVVNKM
jgi:hypothetical protein